MRSIVHVLVISAMAIVLPAQTPTALYNFVGGSDGAAPSWSLVQGTTGYLYGTTQNYGPGSGGTVFEITPGGNLTTLHGFCMESGCADGAYPGGALIQAIDGNLYGTTTHGGAHTEDVAGTVFQLTPAGVFTTLYSFCAETKCPDGKAPVGLLQAASGELYGATSLGGRYGYGTIFRLSTSGQFKSLYSFCSVSGCPDGARPAAPLVQGPDGNLYGTTESGGAQCCGSGGTIFKITTGGAFTKLYTFCSLPACADGQGANGLILGPRGNFYGTTVLGGAASLGTFFEINASGALTTLYSFGTQSPFGAQPNPELFLATDGNFYGTTPLDGNEYSGTFFSITPGGVLTTLYAFCNGCPSGSQPLGGPIQDTNGNFYGTGSVGGTGGYGTVFSLSKALGPFIETQPDEGAVGSVIKILGSSLTGSTGVSFNGTPAAFTVASNSEIVTSVPAGATSGTVQVVATGGTLSSRTLFKVLP